MPLPVTIVEYDPTWPTMYEADAALIRDAVGSTVVAIEHVGSTAVPGLAAKPIVDIMAAVERLSDAALCIEPLRLVGYRDVPEHEAQLPERRYFHKGPPSARTCHLHMVELSSDFWARHLLFRDYLRQHPDAARRYAALKKDLAARFRDDREGYTEAKTPFIRSIERKALALKNG